jgi:cation:H+ antiporter
MNPLWSLIIFLVGLALMLILANVFVNLTSRLAKTLHISPLIVGITIVGLGTSLPELAVSLNAAFEHEPELAAGNIIGSNITNIGLILALTLLMRPIRIGSTKTQKNAVVLLAVTVLFLLLIAAGRFNLMWGLLFLEGAVALLWWEVREGLKGRTREDAVLFADLRRGTLRQEGKNIVLAAFSLVGVFVGGRLVVDASIDMAGLLGIDASLIGLTILALATSLPELVTEVVAVRKGEVKLLLGQTIGSNLYNMLLVGGLASIWSPLYFGNLVGIVFLLLTTVLLFYLVRTHPAKHAGRFWGGVLLGVYIVYLLFLAL